MIPSPAERDELFKRFARALFRTDMDALYAGDISFMTFRVSETVRATGEQREQVGIERYSFGDGRLATKDVYRKPL